ncbi:hypothetical protein BCR39DRAFT_510961 [Naematelia encephala]|uniref:Uncharacterized protein n=1 Tax=Naematelia encephala TaxID=71784 RepID=A0A1Y2BLZ4_9TREE|nr:hypothetical protein BCR39DRAFT_510961 [Naematelia encephala]
MARATALLPVLSPGELFFQRQRRGSDQAHLGRTSSTFFGRYEASSEVGHDELVWDKRTLVWSRGTEVFRKLTFEHEDEDISRALFVWFKTGDRFDTDEKQRIVPSDTFGPFHDPHPIAWGGPSSSHSRTPARLERTLVVFLETRAHVYFSSGEDVVVHLPFPVDGVWALPKGGAIIQRGLEKRELRRLGREKPKSLLRGIDQSSLSALDDLMELEEEGAPDLPRLYTLDDPFEELKMIVQGRNDLVEPLGAQHTTLLVTNDPYALIVVYDRSSGAVIFYRIANLPQHIDKPSIRTMRPEELLRQTDLPRPSLARNPSSFQTDRRLSSAADPLNRTQRRPRVSRGQETTTGDLQAALEPTSFPGSIVAPTKPITRARSVSSASAHIDRRISGADFMREDMVAPSNLDKDLRETTMLMGLARDEQKSRSDLILERIWVWKPPAPFDPDQCFVSENLSPSFVHINIHVSTPHPELHIFPVTLSPQVTIRHSHSVPCIAAVPVLATRHRIFDTLALSPDGHLGLVTSGTQQIPVTLPLHAGDGRDEVARKLATSLSMVVQQAPVDRIVGLVAGPTLIFEDGERLRVSLDHRLRPSLARRCFEALSFALPPDAFFTLKRELLLQIQSLPVAQRGDDLWDVFSRTVRNMLGMPTAMAPAAALDRLSEEAAQHADPTIRRLARSSKPVRSLPNAYDVPDPSILLALHLVAQDCRLSSSRQPDLQRLVPLVVELASMVGKWEWADYWRRILPAMPYPIADTSVLDKDDPPPDIMTYLSRRLVSRTKPFPSPSTCFQFTSELGQVSPCAQTALVVEIYDSFRSLPVTEAAKAMVELIIRRKLTHEWIADLPFGIALPILEMIRVCQYHPPKGWTKECYQFVRRTDLAKDWRGMDENLSNDYDAHATVGALMASINEAAKGKAYQPALPHVRFGSDRRVQEVERIMQTTTCRTINVQDPRGASEQEIVQYHQTIVNTIAHRTLSILFGTRRTTITDLSVKISPNNTEHADWPCFHNGVAAALSISPDCEGITSSWIVFNRPAQLNPEHGGFLLGLGLTGHLKNLLTYHAFSYMEPRHDFTSVGLLLGLACSYAGSGDVLITKILSLHTHAILPLGSMELNASPIIQATSLVGLGILYAASRTLRMAEIALNEIGRRHMPGVDTFGEYQEAYAFSASAAFGLIMLGRGGHASSEVDRRMLARLRRYILGDVGDKSDGPTVTSPCATLALALMYLKSNRRDVADMLEIPQSAFALESVRPDLLLLRTFTRALIMWDEMTPSLGWIEDQLPPFIQSQHKSHKRHSAMELNTELAYLAIVSGACFAIGLKYAGTATELAHNNLLFFFGVLSKAAQGQSMTYEGRIRRNAARQGLNVVTLALAAVMSGTGELNVLRRLRVSHGQEGAGVTYGSHMAMHMAVGILFLGRGYYTLGNSNLAIAAMAISFFPRFLASPADNRAYPQAFRHLWALAVEPRCLIARDVDTGETVYLPVKLKLREGTRQQSLISPTLIAPFESLVSIDVDSPRYWPISYDLWLSRLHSDPKGNRSIFVCAGSMTGFDMHYDLVSPAAPPGVSPQDVVDLIKAHSADPALVALAEKFGGDAPIDAFVRTVLLECVSLDKPHMVGVYMGMFAALSSSDDTLLEQMAQIRFARTFYSPGVYERHYLAPTAGGDKRAALIRPNFLFALARRVGKDAVVDEGVKRTYLQDGVWPPSVGLAVWLANNGVPSAGLLAGLRGLVQQEASGASLVISVRDAANLVIRVRDTARRYAEIIAQSWDSDEHAPVDSKGWKLDSAQEAVDLWLAH